MHLRTDPEIEGLLRRCRGGERAAQRQLYEQYVQAMYNTAIRLVPNRMDAEDIVQDSFVKVFQHLHTFKGESTLGAWIRRITVNTALNFLRRNKRFIILDEAPRESLADPADEEESDSPYPDIRQIHHAIKELPEGSRVVLTLYLIEGYKHKEIAEALGITESTSKTQYLRGKGLLRKKLGSWKLEAGS